jgi:predicted SpoU family rRNA methylase
VTKLDVLKAQRAEQFTAICTLVARDLGYGEFPRLSEEDQNHIESEVKHCVEMWEKTVEIKTNPNVRPMTPFRRLLAEYHDTCERILDEQEIEVGLWAYKKRPQGLRRRSVSF